MLTLLLLLQGDNPELLRFQEAWPRQSMEELAPLAKAVVDAGRNALEVHGQHRIIDVLLRAGDMETLAKLEKASRWPLHVEGERVAATGDLDAQVAFLAKLKPKLGRESTPYAYFAERLHASGRLHAFVERLLETPPEHADVPYYAEAIRSLPWRYFRNVERNELEVRLKTKEKGEASITPQEWIVLADQYAKDRRFGEARAAALKARKGRYLLPAQEAAIFQVLAECHLDAGDIAEAHAACAEGLKASKLSSPAFHLLRARVFLASGDVEGAAKAWSDAFAAVTDWNGELWIAREVREILARKPLPIGQGDPLLLFVAREAAGDLTGAAAALETKKGSLAAGLERVRLRLATGELAKAVEARLELMSLARKRRIERLEELDDKLREACERADAWDVLKAFGRGLAAEPGYHRTRLEKILEAVCEREYLEEIETIGLKAATTPAERWWALETPILAAYRLGWAEEGERRLRGVTVERGFAATNADLAREWLVDFARPDVRVIDALEEVRRRVEEWLDLPGPYRDLSHIWPERLDRAWRARLRRAPADPIALRVGALRGRTPRERSACVEKILREPAAPPAWKAFLAEVRVDAEDDEGAVKLLAAMILVPEERAAAIDTLRLVRHRLSKRDLFRLVEAMDAIEACGWAWEFGRTPPASIPERLRQLERWSRRAAPGVEREQAGHVLAEVLEAQALLLMDEGKSGEAARLLLRALEFGDPDRADDLRFLLLEAQAAAGDAPAVLQGCLVLGPLEEEGWTRLRLILLDLSDAPGFWPAVKALPIAPPDTALQERIRGDLDGLRDEDIGRREAAAAALRGYGRAALEPLRETLDDADVEYRGRVRALLLDALAGRR